MSRFDKRAIAADADLREMQQHYPHLWMVEAMVTGRFEEGLGDFTHEDDTDG